MKSCLLFLFCGVLMFVGGNQIQAKNNSSNVLPGGYYFLENKGQIADQDGCVRNDIQFTLKSGGINVFIGDGQVHYQFAHRVIKDYCKEDVNSNWYMPESMVAAKEGAISLETYRMDVELEGANKGAEVERGERERYYENYYTAGCPENGIRVHTCRKVTYKNVYPGIDWVFLVRGTHLEHEFVVRPGADASQIKLKYHGASSLAINEDGSITATTPMGTIREQAPVCYRADGSRIASAFRLQDKTLSFDVNNYAGALVIDPVVEWGTYYGVDTESSPFYTLATDSDQYVYGCGLTYSSAAGSIATAGSYQSVMIDAPDAYLVKFDSAGNRIWGTYYGGINGNWGTGVAVDKWRNVYLGGTTASPANISTTGSSQPAYAGGGWDGFLAKFDSTGARKWGTYIGGSGSDIPAGVSCDTLGHVYISGFTSSSNNMTTPGAFKTVPDSYEDFLEQYDTAGVRIWGTYFGGESEEFNGVCSGDGNNVYLSGWTQSATLISSPGCYQSARNGSTDAFLVKFDILGNRQWATYFGGPSTEETGSVACDALGGVYLFGYTYSDTNIATPGCYQPTRGGDADAFLTKFDAVTGFPVWGTYLGGPQDETAGLSRISCGPGLVYVTGITLSASGLASPGAWQTTYGGGDDDAFFAAYEFSGNQVFCTYIGGGGVDEGRGCGGDGAGMYVCGQTASTSNIGTPGGFEPTGGGGGSGYDYQGFLEKFVWPVPPIYLYAPGSVQHQSNIGVYPSPNNGNFTLGGSFESTASPVKVIIRNMNGQLIWENEVVADNGVVRKGYSLTDIPAGVYTLTAVSGTQVKVLKFVKE
jgi:hypothetical protein